MELAGVLAIAGFLLLIIGAAMLLPMAVSIVCNEPVWNAFLAGALITLLIGGAMFFIFRAQRQRALRTREGLAVVGISWSAAVVMCSLPLWFSGEFSSYSDALFEASSGLTATGASIMNNVEGASHGVLFWRALMQWLGGMGFIVLSLAVFTFLGLGGMQLYKGEIPSPTPDRLQPRIKDTARALWRIYLTITAIAILSFWLAGMPAFDAFCHALASVASGGFSSRNAGMAAFANPALEWICALVMISSALNYSIYFWLLRKKTVWRDEELRAYLGMIIFCSLGVAIALWQTGDQAWYTALRQGFFHVSSLISSTGFAASDYNNWPGSALMFLILAMMCGGCAGSTSGGPKILRWLVLLKFIGNEIKLIIHPRSVNPLQINSHPLPEEVTAAVCGFFGLYLLCLLATTLALACMGMNLETAFSASLACLGNIGPGLGDIGPYASYSTLPVAGKWLLSLTMVVGRLEIFPVIVLFMPSFWKN
jgi:trk system potassium uptake protein TrkH